MSRKNPKGGDRDSVVPSELIHLRTLSRGSASLHPCLCSGALSVHYRANPMSFPKNNRGMPPMIRMYKRICIQRMKCRGRLILCCVAREEMPEVSPYLMSLASFAERVFVK